MNKECEVARDLMPLYIDGVASEKSAEFVENHVKNCKECADYMEQLKADIPKKTEEEEKQEREAIMQANERLKKKKRGRAWRNIIFGALAACLIIWLGALGYDMLLKSTYHLAPEDYGINLYELKDGSVVCSADYKGRKEQLSTISSSVPQKNKKTGEETAALYLGLDAYRIPKKLEHPLQNGYVEALSADEFSKYDKICKGSPDDYEVVWKRGDKIKPASEEMERYFAWQSVIDKLQNNFKESPDGKAIILDQKESYRYSLAFVQLEAVRATVPEWQPWVYEDSALPLDEGTINWILEKDAPAAPAETSTP